MLHSLRCLNATLPLGLILALFAARPVQAVILPAGDGPEGDARMRAEAHQAGAEETGLVGIAMEVQGRFSLATGVYLGTRPDGQRAFVLTSAHSAVATPAEGVPGLVVVHFPSGPGDPIGVRPGFPVQRVRLHPQFGYRSLPVIDGKGRTWNQECPVHDLAILELDLGPASVLRGELARCGVRPASLYDGPEYRRFLLDDAQMVGFGVLGRQDSPSAEQTFKVHRGFTRVTYGTFLGGEAGFRQWTRVPAASVQARPALGRRVDGEQFVTDLQATLVSHPQEPGAFPVQSHPQQARPSSGDGGGPLFCLDPGDWGWKVAGICSYHATTCLRVAGTWQWETFHLDYWTPVRDHLDWIRDVQEGRPVAGPVLELGGQDAAGAGPNQP
jgi:hypothetical protein